MADGAFLGLPTEPRYPVFWGLAESRLMGKDIAEFTGVTPPTVSKWRRGRARVPDATLAFLTLVLASVIEDLEELAAKERRQGRPSEPVVQALAATQRCLAAQEQANRGLPGKAFREGARLFRRWWGRHEQFGGPPRAQRRALS